MGRFIASPALSCHDREVATVEVREGRPVLVRTGGPWLRREAALLAAAAGPGVPEVVALEDDGTGVRLVTTLAPPLPLVRGELARVGAEVAAILARVHAAGVVHGPLHDEHVLGRPGAVLLGGWDAAGPGTPAADVAELGRLLERHAGGDRAVLALAARATADGAPAMAALAASLEDLAAPVATPRWRPPPLALGGVALAGGLVLAGLLLGSRSDPRPAPATLGIPPAPTTSSTTSTSSTTTWPAHRVHITGNVVERDGERWTVGRPGDVIVVGDWDCDGEVSPAVLRPATGRVWSFTGWSAAGAPEAGRTLATIPGATSVRVEPAGRCDRLRVIGADGQSTMVG
jgi:hypothetical protein